MPDAGTSRLRAVKEAAWAQRHWSRIVTGARFKRPLTVHRVFIAVTALVSSWGRLSDRYSLAQLATAASLMKPDGSPDTRTTRNALKELVELGAVDYSPGGRRPGRVGQIGLHRAPANSAERGTHPSPLLADETPEPLAIVERGDSPAPKGGTHQYPKGGLASPPTLAFPSRNSSPSLPSLARSNGSRSSSPRELVVEALKKALGEHWSELAANGQAEVVECVWVAVLHGTDLDAAVQHIAADCAVNARVPAAVIRSRAQGLRAADLVRATALPQLSTPASTPRYPDVLEVMREAEGDGTRTKDGRLEVRKLLDDLRSVAVGRALPEMTGDVARPNGRTGSDKASASSALLTSHETEERPTMNKQQRRALDILTSWPQAMDVPTLAHQLGTSPQGAARTASSLVGQGLAYRVHIDGKVHYASKLR